MRNLRFRPTTIDFEDHVIKNIDVYILAFEVNRIDPVPDDPLKFYPVGQIKTALKSLVETVAEWDMLDEKRRQEWGGVLSLCPTQS